VLSCLCLTGPTACGKTSLALALAEELPVEIISMDSALVYRGLDIGTDKPPPEQRARVPHHLIDIADPSESYSAGRFVTDAREAIRAVAARGSVPLLVGGTLLYLRALTEGLAPLPSADPVVRQRIDAEAARLGWPALHARLEAIDPEAAGRIAPTDKQRIQRALEVFELTGESISTRQRQFRSAPTSIRVDTLAVIDEDRSGLARRIEERFDAMVSAGFVAEVELLMARGDLRPEMPAMRAVGYRQIWSYLSGSSEWPQARERALAATRQLAKRQMTWLRSVPNLRVLPWSNPRRASRVLEWAQSAGQSI